MSTAPDLEATLVRASIEGMEHDDLRVLAVLVTWFGVHAEGIDADRLTRLVALQASKRVLRDRPADVLKPAELARAHAAYRWPLVIGPGYRADMWAALEREPDLSAAALARATYGSFATAWQSRRDFAVWRTASGS